MTNEELSIIKVSILNCLNDISVEERFTIYSTISKNLFNNMSASQIIELKNFIHTETNNRLNITPFIENDDIIVLHDFNKKYVAVINMKGEIIYNDKTICYKSN